MISGVHKVGIEVEDQERAKEFWTSTMGFEVVTDAAYGEGQRWIELKTPDGAINLVLNHRKGARPAQGEQPTSNVFFYCDDLPQTYEELTAMGVKFPQAPVKMFFGWWSMFEDPDGNRFALAPREE